MTTHRLQQVRTFPALVKYLRDELDWEIETDDFEELTFEFQPEELGIDPKNAAKIRKLWQLRPLTSNQPWGIFFVEFEPKRLPVVVLRKLLGGLVEKKRKTAKSAERAAWQMHDLLFISAFGEGDERQITMAHFCETTARDGVATLHVLGWDGLDTTLHVAHVERQLHEKLRWPEDLQDVDRWRKRWSSAFVERHREVITTAQDLAVRLADLARRVRGQVQQVLAFETERGPLRKLYAGFQEALIHDLSENDFADMYAQTVTYGLFSAAVSRTTPDAGTFVQADNLADMVPITNPFLREMLTTFLTVGGRKGKLDFDELGIQEVVEVLNADETKLGAVLRDFGNRGKGEDPVIHFYEDFLDKFDKPNRKRRGVYYTPQPVVSYIVRSVHELLQTEFGLEDGLASTVTWHEFCASRSTGILPVNESHRQDACATVTIPDGVDPDSHFVTILDPATGTATFLVEVIDVIHRTTTEKWRKQGLTPAQIKAAWNEYVPKHLLPRLHGYELMMAPYAIAHMKIGLKLTETGYGFLSRERARIYLTNALEPPAPEIQQKRIAELSVALAHEAAAVNEIKRHKRFTVVIGNPPYSNYGQLNRNQFILGLLEDYKQGLGEKKLNLDDDFIKFVSFSQFVVASAGVGYVGMITNNSYLDGITHRRMRQSLLESFGRISVTDLHGSTKRREVAPDGTADDNVFDIQQGVSIVVLRRLIGDLRGIQHADLWGTRDAKYSALSTGSCINAKWSQLTPEPPQYFLVPKAFAAQHEYDEFYPLRKAVVASGNGLKTERDGITIHFEKAGIEATVEDFRRLNEAAIRLKYGLESDSRDWKVAKAKTDVLSNKGPTLFRQLLYRPFDTRQTWYSGQTRGFIGTPGYPIIKHLLSGKNLALISGRQGQVMGNIPWDLMLCTSLPVDTNLYYRGGNTVFPLYLCDEVLSFDLASKNDVGAQNANRRPNFTAPFLRRLAGSLQLSQSGTHSLPAGLTPEDIFHYAYAVFHSPGYRSRYAEFLRIDFPRLPLTGNLELFRALARLGGELTALHLLESPKLDQPITEFIGGRSPEVEKISWSRDTVWMDKAQTVGFKGVCEEVWNFHIGGYQVCQKWLKDRKGRTLSSDDIAHYHRIVVALSETIRLMAEIDRVIDQHGGWPGAFASSTGVSPVNEVEAHRQDACVTETADPFA